MGRWSDSKSITKASFGVLKSRPYLLLFPVVGGVLALVGLAIPLGAGLGALGWNRVEQAAANSDVTTGEAIIGVVALALAVYLGTLISQLFLAGLVAAADDELQGRHSTFGSAMGRAFSRFGAVAGWAGIEALVGWLLSALRSNNSGGVAGVAKAVGGSLLGAMWAVITFFALPMIVLRGKGPITAIKDSAKLIRSTWGQQIGGRVRIGGLIVLLGVLPGIIATVAGVLLSANDNAVAGVPLLSLGIIVMLLAGLVVSTLKAIFSVALLHWTENGSAIGPFSDEQMQAAVQVKS